MRPKAAIEQTEPLLTPHEIQELLGVPVRRLHRWAQTEKVSCIKTAGGHRRFRVSDVRACPLYQPPSMPFPAHRESPMCASCGDSGGPCRFCHP